MKKKQIVMLGLLLVLLLCGIVVGSNQSLRDRIYLYYNVDIVTNNDMGENIYIVDNKKNVSMWNLDLQNTIEYKLGKKADKATIDKPFIVYNPYGTNTCALNVYYNSSVDGSLEYSISVENDSVPMFTQVANNTSGESSNKAYQIIGLVPNEVNTVKLQMKDQQQQVISEYSFTIKMGSLVADNSPELTVTNGDSPQEISEGLYTILGHDKAFNANIYIYDNNGVIRSEFPLKGYRSDRILFIGNMMVYSYDFNKIVFVDNLGKIVKKINIGNYEMHHDMIYDEVNQSILVLVNELGTDTIEDVVVRVDLKNNEVSKFLDMKDYMPVAKDAAVVPEDGNTYGGDELDWIHINTIDVIDGKDLLLSSREFSTIIRINNVYDNPEIAYFIADETVWEGTEYESYMLDKAGDFVSQSGQHTVTYLEDDTLEDGQYYVYMFNNNYKGARTRPNFDWSAYVGAGTYAKGDASYFYQYLVDENTNTYELVKSIAIPYSSIVSSTQYYKGNIVTSSGMSNCYDEYDLEGNLIRQFTYTSEKYAYRVFKYGFEGFWFQ